MTHSEHIIELILIHVKEGTLDKSLATRLLYELKTATIEEFAEALKCSE